MLIRITQKCSMGCPHCLVNATPDGEHMTLATFKNAITFAMEVDLLAPLLISGGEPTEHPQFLEFVDLALRHNVKVLIFSNGTFLEDKDYTDKILVREIEVQITNDERFYPRRVPIIEHPKLMYEHKLRVLTPLGRGAVLAEKAQELPVSRAPGCFNLRSMARSMKSLSSTLPLTILSCLRTRVSAKARLPMSEPEL